MPLTQTDIPKLFEQLGMDSSNLAIARFVKNHNLPADVELRDADFWTEAQRQFISDAWKADSDWVEAVDKLDALLRHNN
jgi:hypothetical protein